MTVDEARRSRERSSVAAFYAGRSILVTGVTGFFGKVLIEKLLRSCPDVREIFLLMRPKRGLSIDERLAELLRLPLFERVRAERPASFGKLIPVLGDASAEGLGLGPIERRTLVERVSVIFHAAANVRFRENLKEDVFANTRSTRDVCVLAGGMKKLVALVHVSTAYSQADKPIVEEIAYPPIADWRAVVRTVESLDEDALRIFSTKYLGFMPNTYTFSKRLAEQVIVDYSKDLPCVIFRPSIVISSVADPVAGWLDNFNGPVGLLIAGGKGVLRVACVRPDVAADYLPVDVAIKVMLLAAWKRGLETVCKDDTVHVYNGSSHRIERVTNAALIEMGMEMNESTPLEEVVWYPRVIVTANHFLHYVLTIFLHVLPALLIDRFLEATGRRPMLLRIQKTIYASMLQLRFFLHHEWIIDNARMLSVLTEGVPPGEKETFGYDYSTFSVRSYFHNCLIGAKKYLLNEDPSRLEAAKRRYARMKRIDRIFTVAAILLAAWILAKVGALARLFDSLRCFVAGSFLSE